MHIHILHIKHIYKSKFRKKNASEKAELQKADMYMYVYVQTYIGFYDINVFQYFNLKMKLSKSSIKPYASTHKKN